MPRRLHRKKRRKTSIKFGLLFLLALILVGSGIYVEHVPTEQAASEKRRRTPLRLCRKLQRLLPISSPLNLKILYPQVSNNP